MIILCLDEAGACDVMVSLLLMTVDGENCIV